jgi:protein involved in polysaccharide export with SLBB domain
MLLAGGPALAQLALPVGSQQQSDSSFGVATAGSAQVPPAAIAPFEPVKLIPDPPPSSQAQTVDQAKVEETRRSDLAAPSEFESFVSTLAGKPLRRFGAELLLPAARGFTTPPTSTIPPDYRLNPGDQVSLALAGSVQASNLRLTIDSEGRVFIPQIGAVTLGGVRYGDVRQVVAEAVSRQYRSFDIEVTVAQLHGVTVFVTGFAATPGSYTVGSLSTLVNAVLAAGGPAPGGSFRSIQLRRGGQLVSDFDLYDLLLKGDRSGDVVVQNGDVLYIAPAGEQVAVTGSVNREAIFELAPNETLADAVVYAGGVNTLAEQTRLMVLDPLGQGDTGWREVTTAQAKATVARRGSILRVLSNAGIARPLQGQSVHVTIAGEVARPGHYFFAPGANLAQVIAEAGGTTADAFPYASVITRESVRRQQRESFERAVEDMELLLSAQPLTSANRAELSNPANAAMIQSIVAQMRRREPTGRLVFDLPVDARTLPESLILENNDTIYVPPRPVTVGVFGAVPTPASFAYGEGKRIRDFIALAGGVQKLGDDDEVFVVRANGTVLSKGGATLNAPALPGDLIYVPVDANRGEFWARLRDITSSLFGGAVGAASIYALVK